LGTAEAKRAGGARGDRKIPEKVIPLAAKTVSMYVDDLDRRLSAQPAGIERTKFIMAADNGGVNLLATAQEEAIKMNRDGTTWESLIRGGEPSSLLEALNKTYKADKRVAKYKEVTEYIEKIFARPQQRSTGSG